MVYDIGLSDKLLVFTPDLKPMIIPFRRQFWMEGEDGLCCNLTEAHAEAAGVSN